MTRTPPPPLSEDKQVEFLLDHYRDTSQQIQRHRRSRNRLFMYILVVLPLIVAEIHQPGWLPRGANSWMAKNVGEVAPVQPQHRNAPETNAANSRESTNSASEHNAKNNTLLEPSVIYSAMWFLLACLVVPYYQLSVHVDCQHRYIVGVEKKLCDLVDDPSFITREGIAYQSRSGDPATDGQRPILLQVIALLYMGAIPLMLIPLVFSRVRFSRVGDSDAWLNNLDILSGILIVVFSLLYVAWAVRRYGAEPFLKAPFQALLRNIKAPLRLQSDGRRERGDEMKLNVKAFALSCGLVWGFSLLLITWWIIAFDGTTGEPTLIGRVYRGYSISPVGSLIGLAWGLLDGVIGGAIFAWGYNLLVAFLHRRESAGAGAM